jgi:hypothetical protein
VTWLGLLAVAVAVFQLCVVVWVARTLAEIRGYRDGWRGLVDTQRKHEIDVRYLRELVNPMARSGHAPLPKHLRQEI